MEVGSESTDEQHVPMDLAAERVVVSVWASPNMKTLPAAMPSLHRWGDQDRIHYVTMTPGAVDPLVHTLRGRLKRIDEVIHALERLCPCLTLRSERTLRLMGQVREVTDRLWRWHTQIRMLRNHNNPALVRTLMDMSWVLMIRAQYLTACAEDVLAEGYYDAPPRPVCMSQNVWSAYPFVRLLKEQKRGVIFTHPMGRMKLLTLAQWNTVYLEFKRIFVRTGYSPSAAAYIQAILHQYGFFIHNGHGDPAVYDMDRYRAAHATPPSRLLGAPLTDGLIHDYEGELFYLMRHLRATQAFAARGTWRPMRTPVRQAALKVVGNFVSAMVKDKRMFTEVLKG
jgi:hypothetical protein